MWCLVAGGLLAGGCGADEAAELVRRWEDPPGVAAGILAGPDEPAVVVAAEASPQRMRRVRAEYMNSSQIAAYLRRGGDLAIVPLGSMEMHGPHAPLGTTTFIHHATAVLLAERWDAIVFPPIPYLPVPRSEGWPGTVSVPVEESQQYLRSVVDSLLDGGFRRVVLLAGRARYPMIENLVRDIERQRGDVVLVSRTDLLPDNEKTRSALGYEPGDDIRVLAALKILGHPGAFDPSAGAAGPALTEFDRSQAALAAKGVRVAGAYGSPGASLPVRDCVQASDADKAIALMRQEARRCDALPVVYAQYRRELAAQRRWAPWSVANYARTAADSRFDVVKASYPSPVAPAVPERSTEDVRIAASAVPPEASPEHLRRHRAEFMSAAQMAAYLRRSDVAILPVGAFEMHGPHGLLNTDTIEAHSASVLVAERWNAVVMPSICYTYSGATEPWPGSVSLPPDVVVRYVRSVVEALLDGGFKRVVLCWVHAPGGPMGQQVLQEVWQRRRQVVFSRSFRPLRGDVLRQAVGYGSGEDVWSLAGAAILGHPGVFVVDEPRDVGMIKLPYHSIVDLTAMGCRPTWYMSYPTQHLAVRSCVKSADVPKMLQLMREEVRQLDGLPEAMSEYLRAVEALDKQSPWLPANWPAGPATAPARAAP